ncbi:MAG: hypothetical protein CVU11_00285 [Bacteroidetes bacterium HGW-Bacteroidetes-6]|jgi:hypothetical protein|nr:MAG: hypothetical protein CVU11_00285 [Bacteroidetes bacterium HGW-Bacteroidetes-6]
MKTKWILWILCSVYTFSAQAQTFTEQKTFHRSFATTPNTEISINNKYGNIVLVPSETDSVIFDIDVSVTDKHDYEALEQLDEIGIDFIAAGYIINAITSFDGNRNDFKTDWKMFAGSVFSSSKIVKVNYLVAVPAEVSVVIENSYGNVLMGNHSGAFKLLLSGGDFTAGVLEGKTTINMSGGNMNCRYLADALVNIDMTEVFIDSIANVYFDSRASQITIQKAKKLTIDSRRDKWFMNEIEQLGGSGSFSSFSVNTLQTDCNLKTFYGNLTFQRVADSFKNISLIASYTDVTIGMPTAAQPAFQCEMKKTRSLFPATLNLKTDTLDAKAGMFRCYNSVENSSSTMNMNLTGGSISVF